MKSSDCEKKRKKKGGTPISREERGAIEPINDIEKKYFPPYKEKGKKKKSTMLKRGGGGGTSINPKRRRLEKERSCPAMKGNYSRHCRSREKKKTQR